MSHSVKNHKFHTEADAQAFIDLTNYNEPNADKYIGEAYYTCGDNVWPNNPDLALLFGNPYWSVRVETYK
tara:strand:+ start:6938 stop:7147 length:210 start_codon:yes stop_codon:yes gene_type:complete